jgi:hypothetical protein
MGEWNFPDAPLKGVFARGGVYSAVTGWDNFEPWLSRIEHFDPQGHVPNGQLHIKLSKPQARAQQLELPALTFSKANCKHVEIGSWSRVWQDHGKRCSLRLACARTNQDGASVLFDDLSTDPQAEAISRRTFGREKWLKYPR